MKSYILEFVFSISKVASVRKMDRTRTRLAVVHLSCIFFYLRVF